MPWVPRIPPKGEADADSSAPREKAAAPKEKPAAEETESAESRAQREKAQSYLAMRGAELWLDLQQRKLQGKKMTKFLTDELYAEIKKQLENPKKPDRPCWYFNIDVSATELTAEGLKILVAFLKRLYQANPPVCVHSLRCYNNDLGDEGAEQIAELILAQPYAISELHLSHSRMTELGAATVILSVCVANDRYPFQVKHRWTGCWIRLENNHVSAPDALLTAMRATLLPGKEWDEQMVHIEAIARGDRTWGRAHGPHWATSAEVTPQALLYTFHEQQGVLDAGYGKKESVAGIRAARRATDSAREAVLEMHKKLNDHDDYDNQQGTHRPARVRLSEDRVVVARYRRGADEVPEKKEEAWVPEPKRVAKIHDTRPFRMAVDSLKPLADSREAPASSTRWVTYGKGGKVGSGTAVAAVAAPASTTRRSHEAHEYANAIGSGGGKGESPPKGSKGAAPKGKQLNVTQPKEEDHSTATASSPPTAATAAGKGAVQKGKGRSKDAGKLVWKSKVTKAPEESSKEEQRPEAAPKVESSKASTSTDVKEPQATSKDAKSAKDVEKAEDPKEAKAAKEAKDAGKDANEAKDAKAAGAKEVKDSKEAAATKEAKDAHEAKATEAKDANEAKDAKVMAAKEAKDSKEVKAKETKDTQEAKDEQATPVKEAKDMKDEKGASTKMPADSKAKHTEHVQATKPAAKDPHLKFW
ncbi:rpsF [Symbiodinium natans]|uniref:RpsF protein n=1 Tax=Symbiodinium natans TaxID=878477 RepID=A0A812PJV2_9DINO|nr:rpsF [Symbiodinium natans]